MTIIELLNEMRNHGGPARTTGLPDDVILSFAKKDKHLTDAIENAHPMFLRLREDEPALLAMDEATACRTSFKGKCSRSPGPDHRRRSLSCSWRSHKVENDDFHFDHVRDHYFGLARSALRASSGCRSTSGECLRRRDPHDTGGNFAYCPDTLSLATRLSPLFIRRLFIRSDTSRRLTGRTGRSCRWLPLSHPDAGLRVGSSILVRFSS